MKRFFVSNVAVLSVLASLFVLTACSEKDEVGGDGTYNVVVEAVKGATDGSVFTRALELSNYGMTLNAPWEAGEEVYVYRMNVTAQNPDDFYQPLGTLTAQTSGVTTTLAGQLRGTISVGDNLMFSYQRGLLFNYTGQDGSLDKIAKDYDNANSGSSVTSVGTSTITLPSALKFSSMQSVMRFTLTDEEGAPIVPDKLVFDTKPGESGGQYPQFIQQFDPAQADYNAALKFGAIEVSNPSSNVIFVALSGNYDGTRIMGGMNNANLVMTATVGEDVYVYEKSGFSFVNDKYYVYEVVMKKQ